jgi:hypothetical protein
MNGDDSQVCVRVLKLRLAVAKGNV